MRFWHLTGVNLRKNAGFFLVGGKPCPPDFVRLNLLNPNQRYECHLGIPRMAFIGVENPSHKKVYP